MPLSLVKRSTNGAPVSATQNDANMTAIESAVNTNTSGLASKVDTGTFNSAFTGFAGAKGNVAWANVITRPHYLTSETSFRAVKTDSSQTISAGGDISPTFGTVVFNNNGLFNAGANKLSAPYDGVYLVGTSVQVALDSGSPTNVSIITYLNVNGAPVEGCTLDNTGTGIRIYKFSTLLSLTAGDLLDVAVSFSFSGTATWAVEGSNTNFWGRMVYTAT